MTLPKIFQPLREDIDFIFFVNFAILMLIAILMMFFSNGVSTIRYIDNLSPQNVEVPNFPLSLGGNYSTSTEISPLGSIMKYKTDLIKIQYRIPYIMLVLYWLVLPLFNLVSIFFPKPKDLNITTPT